MKGHKPKDPAEQTKSFEEWAVVYRTSPPHSKEETQAVEEMAKLATTFDQLDTLANASFNCPEILTPTLDKMAKMATTGSDWQSIWNSSPANSEMEKRAEAEIAKL